MPHLLFLDCGTCSRVIRIETAELSLKGTVGSYECFGHFKRKSSYKMSDNSLYLYDRIYDKKERKNGWMVRKSNNMLRANSRYFYMVALSKKFLYNDFVFSYLQ